MNIFNEQFLNFSKEVLNNNCKEGATFFKKDFAKLLGFNVQDAKNLAAGLNIISIMFDMGYFSNYKILPGKHGGITHVNFIRKNTESLFPVDFLNRLFGVLLLECKDTPISRNKIAQKLNYNLPEDEICNLITLAFQKKYIIGFKGKPGKNGGIVKIANIEPKLSIEGDQELASMLAGSNSQCVLETSARPSFWDAIAQSEEPSSQTKVV